MKTPLVTAIVSTYNSERFIEGKLIDLLNQTIVNELEIIIINSGSQQNEEKIVYKYMKDYSCIKYIKTINRETIYQSWNRGIKLSSGLFITNSNTDDRLKKDALEILANALKNSDAGLVYADQYYTYTENEEFKENMVAYKIYLPDYDPFLHLRRCLVLSQPMWRRDIHFKDNIWFKEHFEICGDHEFYLNLSQKYKLLYVPQVLGSFYRSAKNENKSFSDIDKVLLERRKATEYYIKEYICGMDINGKQYKSLKNKFKFFTTIPNLMYIAGYKVLAYLYPEKSLYDLEFSYYFNSVILEKEGKIKQALKLCNKYLKRKYSSRIFNQKKYLEDYLKN